MSSKNQMEKALNSLASRLQKTEKFVLGQAPDICREIIRRDLAADLFWSIIMVVTTISFGITARKVYLVYDSSSFPMFIWPTLCGIVSGLLALATIDDLISVFVAPKLRILETIKGLLSEDKK